MTNPSSSQSTAGCPDPSTAWRPLWSGPPSALFCLICAINAYSIWVAGSVGIAVTHTNTELPKLSGSIYPRKMLERARATTHSPGIKYLRCAIEDIDFPANEFDIVISSLALHYVES